MVSKKADEKMIDELYELISSLDTKEDCRKLFSDLCTVKEIEQMAQRIKAAKLLLAGNTYGQVIEQCDISSATLSRVSRCVRYGEGYNKYLK
ncbi:MAG: TrpR-related protein YerC/YecD [Clostridia bacterium]|jgi:TrpR-related protein YerC/YecD|nr:TrpR-related protein YerC/YecD [Clostridia bacterium]